MRCDPAPRRTGQKHFGHRLVCRRLCVHPELRAKEGYIPARWHPPQTRTPACSAKEPLLKTKPSVLGTSCSFSLNNTSKQVLRQRYEHHSHSSELNYLERATDRNANFFKGQQFINPLPGYIHGPVLAVNFIYSGSTSLTADHYHLRIVAPPDRSPPFALPLP